MLNPSAKEAITHLLREEITSGKEVSLKVAQGSMQPLINPGDRVVVKDCRAENLIPGDIILYEKEGTLYTHRFLYRRELSLLTKGDNALFLDTPFPKEQLLGKVITIKKKSRTIDLRKRSWRIINSVLAILSLIEGLVLGIARKLKRGLFGHEKIQNDLEDRLILLCARTRIDSETKDEIRKLLGEELNWDYLLKKAEREGLSGLLYYNLRRFDERIVPPGVMETLEERYFNITSRNLLFVKELGRVLKAFKEAGIPALVLKGAFLIEEIYKNPGLRSMSDIDLLVRKKNLLQAHEGLKGLGYTTTDNYLDYIEKPISGYLNSLFYYRKEKEASIPLHIHWHLVNSSVPNYMFSSRIDMDGIWEEAEKIKIADREALSLAPHHLIIYLSEHALRMKHSLDRLILLCDISEVIEKYQDRLDWKRIIKDSFMFNLDRMVYYNLYLVKKLLGRKIPSHILKRLEPERLGYFEKKFVSFISRNRRFPGLSYLLYLSLNRGPLAKGRFIFRTFFPPRQVMAQRNNISRKNLTPLHYLRHLREVLGPLPKLTHYL